MNSSTTTPQPTAPAVHAPEVQCFRCCVGREIIQYIDDGTGSRVGFYTAAAMAIVDKKWEIGAVLKVLFLSGDVTLQGRILKTAQLWVRYANLTLTRVTSGPADIRILIDNSRVSESYIGTDARSVTDQTQFTMRFGWLTVATPDEELRRVVLHEFGHALGLGHEHQSPHANIQWNEAAVFEHYRGLIAPPNGNWASEQEYQAHVRQNVINKWSTADAVASNFDRHSIMLYPIDASLTLNGFSTTTNTNLSDIDRAFIASYYPGRVMRFTRQIGTALHETDGGFVFLFASNGDLFIIKKRHTGSGRTEVHVLSAASNYSSFVLHTGTALHETGDSFQFVLAPNRDVVAISQSGTGSHSTEVHVLSAELSYQSFSLHTPTALHVTGRSFAFAMAANRDLFAISRAHTGSGTTEVHVLSAASSYRSFSLQTRTALHETGSDDSFAFLVAQNRDLFCVKKCATGTNSTEIHVLDASHGYQRFNCQVGTMLHETDATFDFALSAQGEVVAVKKSRTGTHSTELHFLRL